MLSGVWRFVQLAPLPLLAPPPLHRQRPRRLGSR
jgi:hypothetical protein